MIILVILQRALKDFSGLSIRILSLHNFRSKSQSESFQLQEWMHYIHSCERKLHFVKKMKRSKFDSVKRILLCIRKVCMIRFWLTLLLAVGEKLLCIITDFEQQRKSKKPPFYLLLGMVQNTLLLQGPKINDSTNALTSKNIF